MARRENPLGLLRVPRVDLAGEGQDVIGPVGRELDGLSQRCLSLLARGRGQPAGEEAPGGSVLGVGLDGAARQDQPLVRMLLLGHRGQRLHVAGVLVQRLAELRLEGLRLPLPGQVEANPVHLGGREHAHLDPRVDCRAHAAAGAGDVAGACLEDQIERLGAAAPGQAPLREGGVPRIDRGLGAGQATLERDQRLGPLGGEMADQEPGGGIQGRLPGAAPGHQLANGRLPVVPEPARDPELRGAAHGAGSVRGGPGHGGQVRGQTLREPPRLARNGVQGHEVRHLVRDHDLLLVLGEQPRHQEPLPSVVVVHGVADVPGRSGEVGQLLVRGQGHHLDPVRGSGGRGIEGLRQQRARELQLADHALRVAGTEVRAQDHVLRRELAPLRSAVRRAHEAHVGSAAGAGERGGQGEKTCGGRAGAREGRAQFLLPCVEWTQAGYRSAGARGPRRAMTATRRMEASVGDENRDPHSLGRAPEAHAGGRATAAGRRSGRRGTPCPRAPRHALDAARLLGAGPGGAGLPGGGRDRAGHPARPRGGAPAGPGRTALPAGRRIPA